MRTSAFKPGCMHLTPQEREDKARERLEIKRRAGRCSHTLAPPYDPAVFSLDTRSERREDKRVETQHACTAPLVQIHQRRSPVERTARRGEVRLLTWANKAAGRFTLFVVRHVPCASRKSNKKESIARPMHSPKFTRRNYTETFKQRPPFQGRDTSRSPRWTHAGKPAASAAERFDGERFALYRRAYGTNTHSLQ